MSKQRIGFIDIAKAFAIFFVIVGHTGLICSQNVYPSGGMSPWIVNWIFTFHMPLFFIVSGYFFKKTEINKAYFKKEWISLLRPYVITALIVIILATVSGFFFSDRLADEEFFKWLGAALYGEGAETPVSIIPVYRIGAIWFLLALFWGRLLLNLAMRSRYPLIILVSLFAIACWSGEYIWLPWSIQSGMGCALFLYIGYVFKERKSLIEQGSGLGLFAYILLGVCWIICSMIDSGGVSMAMCIYPLGVLSIIGGIGGSMYFIEISKMIERNFSKISKFLEWIGRNTLAIFAIHLVEDDVIRYDLILSWMQNSLGDVSWILVLIFRMCVISALCGLFYVIPGINRVYFAGKRKNKKKIQTAE